VTIYRAVPYEKTAAEKLADLQKQKAKYMARGILPDGWGQSKKSMGDQQGFYDWVTTEITKLESAPQEAAQKLKINRGDWVTTSRAYARQHGESALGGKYKVISQ
jgi:flagellar biosynthesis chaperone FliJ